MSLERARSDLAGLESAVAQLRAKLADAEERAAKVRIYIEMAEVYGASGLGPDENAQRSSAPRKMGRPRSEGGIVERAQKASEELIRAAQHALPTRDLLAQLEARGIHIGGTQPRSNLSGMLSKSAVFKSNRDGWTLAEWETRDATETLGIDPSDAGYEGEDSPPSRQEAVVPVVYRSSSEP